MNTRALTTKSCTPLWEKLGRPTSFSAPMVNHSELAWRLLVKKHGCNVAFSQMLHARNFANSKKFREDFVDWLDYTPRSGLKHEEEWARELDKSIIAQFAGDDPASLVKAGKYIENSVAAIDLNLGCPQQIAKRGHYGAYLLPEKNLVRSILEAMVQNLNCPITVKIRKLENEEDTLALCEMIEKCGVQMLTVHCRTVQSSKQFVGPPDWDIIRKVKQTVSIPVVANGGISCRKDVLDCLQYTGADAVMSSEGLLENPRLFDEEGDKLFHENFIPTQFAIVTEYLDLVRRYPLPKPSGTGTVIRGHLFKLLHRFLSAPTNFDIRETLAKVDLDGMCTTFEQLKKRYEDIGMEMSIAEEKQMITPARWYWRHR